MFLRCAFSVLISSLGWRAVSGGCFADRSSSIAGPLVPKRVQVGSAAGWEAALDALLADGAVVLQGLEDLGRPQLSFRELAAGLPARLFEGSGAGGKRPIDLLSPDAPVNGVHDELRQAREKGYYLPGSGLEPHTDGYVYGDDMPDYLFLVCEQPSLQGGANVLLDGQRLLDGLEADERGRELSRFLSTVDIDLSEPGDSGIMTGRPAKGPMVQWHSAQAGGRERRLKWRRQINVAQTQKLATWQPLSSEQPEDVSARRCGDLANASYLSLWRPLQPSSGSDAADVDSRLREFDLLLQKASAEAFADHSFSLSRGEALVADNYRVLHGRAPYRPDEVDDATSGAPKHERLFWRVWSWTSEGTGLPPDGARSSNPMNKKVFEEAADAKAKEEL